MGKSKKKRTKNTQRGNVKVNRAAKPEVAASTITLVDLFMDIMRSPRAITPKIEQARYDASISREIARCEP
jgi:hypothetical protein